MLPHDARRLVGRMARAVVDLSSAEDARFHSNPVLHYTAQRTRRVRQAHAGHPAVRGIPTEDMDAEAPGSRKRHRLVPRSERPGRWRTSRACESPD
jgi:hypothetical protein